MSLLAIEKTLCGIDEERLLGCQGVMALWQKADAAARQVYHQANSKFSDSSAYR